MQRSTYRTRSAPKNKSRSRIWHRKPAAKAKSKPIERSGTFINIGQEMKHGRGPQKIVPTLRYKFDDEMTVEDRDRIKGVIEQAFRSGEIIPCECVSIEALVYATVPPDFQASFACGCDAMRPLYSSTPDTED